MSDIPGTAVDARGYPQPRRKLARGWRPNPAQPMTPERKAKFLLHLAEYGIVGEAAKAASLHSHRGCINSWYAERKADEKFAELWDEALEAAKSRVELELHRRAVQGVDEPVYFKGKKCGDVKRYSDVLLLALIRKLDPAYRPTAKVEHGGKVTLQPLDLDKLTPTQREHLRAILIEEETKPARAIVVSSVPLLDTGNGEASSVDASTEDGIDEQDDEQQEP